MFTARVAQYSCVGVRHPSSSPYVTAGVTRAERARIVAGRFPRVGDEYGWDNEREIGGRDGAQKEERKQVPLVFSFLGRTLS